MREFLLLISRQIHWCTVRGPRGELGPERRLSAEELMLLNCGAKKTSESPLDSKEIKAVLKEINPEYSLEGLS